MRGDVSALTISLITLLLMQSACTPTPDNPPVPTDPCSNPLSVCMHYMADAIDIMPLTDFIPAQNPQQQSIIEVYVSLLDTFGSQIKAPGVFRFELYKHIERSAKPKGERITMWSDIVLNDSDQNNDYWQDYLRAYKFNLDFEPELPGSYILQATCTCPSGKRLSSDYVLTVRN
jgi:hypothetical protein